MSKKGVIALACAASLIAGCGGGGDGESTGAPTKAEFISQADAICAFARLEGLEAHARAVEARSKR